MKNFIKPKIVLGTIKITPVDWTDKYYIGEANLAIEKIGDVQILNIWANSYHYELHNEKEVFMGDVGFEIMQPIDKELAIDRTTIIDSPNDRREMENKWEELYYGHFYQFEHLKLTKWNIKIKPFNSNCKIDIKAYISDDILDESDAFFLESSFDLELTSKIDSKWNSNYSSLNPNAINKSK